MTDEELSSQYHSLRLYYGEYDTYNVNYRIGDVTTVVPLETERYIDTWMDLRLIPTERPTVSLPKGNSKIINIPGNRFPIDMTNYLTGHTTYSNRTGTWSFYTDNDFVEENGGFEVMDKILKSTFHSHVYKVELRDDPDYFYIGRLSVGQWNTGAERSTVSISYNLYPYKKSKTCTLDMWLFDEFNFDDGIIQYVKNMEVNSERIIDIIGSPERVNPHISATGTLTLEKYENSSWVSYGTIPTLDIGNKMSVIPGFMIENGINRLRIRGNGRVTLDYRRGLL